MAFSDFDLRRALTDFGLTEDTGTDLFAGTPPVEPSPFLRVFLDEFARQALGLGSEAARSHYIIGPFLMEAQRRATGPVNVMPGVTLDVDRARGLNGYCDFIIARTQEIYFLRGPLAAVVEAKREDIIGGLGQCAASMVGLREFNARDGTPVEEVFGAVTSGNIWRFLRLRRETLAIDRQEYHLRDAPTLLGILVRIANGGGPA